MKQRPRIYYTESQKSLMWGNIDAAKNVDILRLQRPKS